MSMKKDLIIDLLVAIVLPVALIAGYYLWSGEDVGVLTSESVGRVDDSAEIKRALAEVSKISFTATLVGSDAYRSLQDFTAPIPSDEFGRENPFVPAPKSSRLSPVVTPPSAAEVSLILSDAKNRTLLGQ